MSELVGLVPLVFVGGFNHYSEACYMIIMSPILDVMRRISMWTVSFVM